MRKIVNTCSCVERQLEIIYSRYTKIKLQQISFLVFAHYIRSSSSVNLLEQVFFLSPSNVLFSALTGLIAMTLWHI